MAKNLHDNLKILLLQFRLAPEMRKQELNCYFKFGKLKRKQITPHYMLEKNLNVDSLKKFDAVIVGGTGDFGVYQIKNKYPRIYKQLKDTAIYCRKKEIPIISICMQFWAIIFGGEVKTDISRQEIGTFTIKLTDEGKKDPLFKHISSEFKAHLGHKDYISKLPNGATLLAYSDLCPVQAFRLGSREYVLQFHPELDKKTLIERIKFYRGCGYAPDTADEFDQLIESIEETPISNSLIKKFIDRIVLN